MSADVHEVVVVSTAFENVFTVTQQRFEWCYERRLNNPLVYYDRTFLVCAFFSSDNVSNSLRFLSALRRNRFCGPPRLPLGIPRLLDAHAGPLRITLDHVFFALPLPFFAR